VELFQEDTSNSYVYLFFGTLRKRKNMNFCSLLAGVICTSFLSSTNSKLSPSSAIIFSESYCTISRPLHFSGPPIAKVAMMRWPSGLRAFFNNFSYQMDQLGNERELYRAKVKTFAVHQIE